MRLVLAVTLLVLGPASAFAEEPAPSEGATPGGEMEALDETRLDVERLPPEAIALDRDMYAHGFFFDVSLSGRGFIGGLGRIVKAGPALSFAMGYELAPWFYAYVGMDASMHQTDAPAPPAPSVVEVIDAVVGLRLQINASARAAVFIGGRFGLVWVMSDAPFAYGFRDFDTTGIMGGGELGFDWHMRTRHHSFGIKAGADVMPSLRAPQGDLAIAVHGEMYLRYVFGN